MGRFIVVDRPLITRPKENPTDLTKKQPASDRALDIPSVILLIMLLFPFIV